MAQGISTTNHFHINKKIFQAGGNFILFSYFHQDKWDVSLLARASLYRPTEPPEKEMTVTGRAWEISKACLWCIADSSTCVAAEENSFNCMFAFIQNESTVFWEGASRTLPFRHRHCLEIRKLDSGLSFGDCLWELRKGCWPPDCSFHIRKMWRLTYVSPKIPSSAKTPEIYTSPRQLRKRTQGNHVSKHALIRRNKKIRITLWFE